MMYNKLTTFELWISAWITLLEGLTNIFLVPFGHHVHWDFDYSVYLLKKRFKKCEDDKMKITKINGIPLSENEFKQIEQNTTLQKFNETFINERSYKFGEFAPNERSQIIGEDILPFGVKIWKPNIDATFMYPQAQKDLLEVDERILEAENMNPEVLKLREQYEKDKNNHTKHYMINAKPVTTELGTFNVTSCAVCRQAWVRVNGQMYTDDVMKLLNWIAHISIEEKKKNQNVNEVMNILGVEEKPVESFTVGDLLTTTNPEEELLSLL